MPIRIIHVVSKTHAGLASFILMYRIISYSIVSVQSLHALSHPVDAFIQLLSTGQGILLPYLS